MASEVLKLTAQIVISHASMSELTPKELVEEIKDRPVYAVVLPGRRNYGGGGGRRTRKSQGSEGGSQETHPFHWMR